MKITYIVNYRYGAKKTDVYYHSGSIIFHIVHFWCISLHYYEHVYSQKKTDR